MGFPDHVVESAFGEGALPRLHGVVAHLRREAHQLHLEAEAVRADPTGGAQADASAFVLDLRAAEIEQRIDSTDGDLS